MPVQVTTTIVDCDATGNANEWRAKLQHSAAFPIGGVDSLGNPLVERHAITVVIIFTAVDKPTFIIAVKASGTAWRDGIIAMISGRLVKVPATMNVGDSFTY